MCTWPRYRMMNVSGGRCVAAKRPRWPMAGCVDGSLMVVMLTLGHGAPRPGSVEASLTQESLSEEGARESFSLRPASRTVWVYVRSRRKVTSCGQFGGRTSFSGSLPSKWVDLIMDRSRWCFVLGMILCR